MTHTDSNAPGAFCWVELATTDQNAAKQFYSGLFGWQAADFPMGPSELYTIFRLDGRDAAAAYTLRKEQADQGVPPHWLLYISTADIEASAARAKQLGGTVLAGPFDVSELGKMCVIRDPGDAVFALWQAISHHGIGVRDQPGAFCWADLMTPDVTRAKEFYKALLGWEIAPGENDQSGYLHIKNGETFIGGMPPSEHQPPNTPPHWSIYYLVSKCDESTAKAKQLGGKVRMDPMSIPNVGRMSVVADPQGAVFSLFEASPKA